MRLAQLACLLLGLASPALAQEPTQADLAERWKDVASAIFPDKTIGDGSGLIRLSVPARSIDAGLVPVKVEFTGIQHLAALSVVIDANPMPLAGSFRLGAGFVQKDLRIRVRVNDYTLIHAIAETDDGKLYAVASYIQAAGGCSSPSTGESAEILARLGSMQLRRTRPLDSKDPPTQLMISHPNFSGMSRGSGAQDFTPARYIEQVSMTVGGQSVFQLDGGFSLSEDPSINFTYHPLGDGAVEVTTRDSSGAIFRQHFPPLD